MSVVNISSWQDSKMDWNNPNPYELKYYVAIRNAIIERLNIIGQPQKFRKVIQLFNITDRSTITHGYLELIRQIIIDLLEAKLFINLKNLPNNDLNNLAKDSNSVNEYLLYYSLSDFVNYQIPNIYGSISGISQFLKRTYQILNLLTVVNYQFDYNNCRTFLKIETKSANGDSEDIAEYWNKTKFFFKDYDNNCSLITNYTKGNKKAYFYRQRANISAHICKPSAKLNPTKFYCFYWLSEPFRLDPFRNGKFEAISSAKKGFNYKESSINTNMFLGFNGNDPSFNKNFYTGCEIINTKFAFDYTKKLKFYDSSADLNSTFTT